MRVGIVGLGLIGASLALALRRAGAGEIVGEDLDPAVEARARRVGIIAEGDARSAGVLVLAVPIGAMPGLLSGLAGRAGPVTDVASTKAAVMRWAAAAGVDLVGGHPMCGSERSGIGAADPGMFQGAPWILTRDEPAVTAMVRAAGAVPVFMDPERHDRAVAGASHAAFLTSVAYLLAMAESPEWGDIRAVAGPGFRDMTRLAAGDPELYAAIVATNRARIAEALAAVESRLRRLRRHVEAEDARLVELLEEARAARRRWERDAGQG